MRTVDLFQYILGDFYAVAGAVATIVWDMVRRRTMYFCLFKTTDGQTAERIEVLLAP